MANRRSASSAPAADSTQGDSQSVDLHAWLYVLGEKWRIIALSVFGMLALAGAYLLWKAPVFTGVAVVNVQEDPTKVIQIQDVSPENYKSDEALKSVESAFNSNSLLLRVAKVNNLANEEPAFRAAPGNPPLSDAEIADTMQRKLDAKLKRGSRTIEIDFDSSDPQRAAKVARSIVDEYMKMYFEQNAKSATMANEFLRNQAADLKDRLAKSEQMLQEYREKYGTVSVEDKQNMTSDYLKQLNLKLEEARSNRVKVEADLTVLRKSQTLPVEELLALQSVSSLPEIQDALKLITAKESEFSQIKKRYLDQHPKYIQAQGELNGLRQSLDKAARKGAAIALNSYKGAKEAEEKLQSALKEQEKSGVALSRIAIPYEELRRQSESDRQLYESVLARLKETKLSEGLDKTNIRIIQEPIAPRWPSKPKVPLILALACSAGLMVGLGLIVVQQAFDTSLRSVDQAEAVLDLPSLAAVPETKAIRGKRGKGEPAPLPLIDDPSSPESEAFRCLRTSLSLLKGGAPKSVLFTSATPGEGKSFCAANYSVSLAQQNLRTLVIDGDLRRPGLGLIFPTPDGAAGLSDVLSGKNSFDAGCHETKVPKLFVMPAGTRNSSPLELLSDGKFTQIVREALEKYDRVVLDSAPINAVSDTLMMVEHVCAVAFVARARHTPARSLVRALHLLDGAHATPAGFILNRLPARLAAYYYYYAGDYSSAGVYGT
jgi:capsular exopolysaccharide synthesis family protein